jgi:hypothetical protein
MFIDGHTVKVRVPHPPPEVFTLAQPKTDRVLVLRTYSKNGAIYVERDRRKAALPVPEDRRRRRHRDS